jgi:hypothetical protein
MSDFLSRIARLKILCALIVVIASTVAPARGQSKAGEGDWRGAGRTGVSRESGFATSLVIVRVPINFVRIEAICQHVVVMGRIGPRPLSNEISETPSLVGQLQRCLFNNNSALAVLIDHLGFLSVSLRKHDRGQ